MKYISYKTNKIRSSKKVDLSLQLKIVDIVYVLNHVHHVGNVVEHVYIIIKFHDRSVDIDRTGGRIKHINMSHLQYMLPCDTICKMLEPAKELGQAAKYVNHPSYVTDLHWNFESLQVYSSDMN